MKLFLGGSTEPREERLEEMLGLHHHDARRAAGRAVEPEDAESLAPTLEIVTPSWDEWNLTLANVEPR